MIDDSIYLVTGSFVPKNRHIFMMPGEDDNGCMPLITRDLNSARGFILTEIAKKFFKEIKNPIEVFFRLQQMEIQIHKIPCNSIEEIGKIISLTVKEHTFASMIDSGPLGKEDNHVQFVVADYNEDYLNEYIHIDYKKEIIKEMFY